MTAGLVYGSLVTGAAIGLLLSALLRGGDRSDIAEAHLQLWQHAYNAHLAWTDKAALELVADDCHCLALEVDLADRMAVLGDTLAHVDAVSRA